MGIHHLTMEVSSQALKYHRTLGVQFKVGIFLNIGQDHISELEHPDFEDYLDSKLRLFSQCEMALVHNDGPYFSKVLEAAKEGAQKVVTFGRNPGSEIWGHDLVTREEGTEFSVSFDGVTELFQINMKGTFNVDNALAAISACLILEIPISIIKKGLAKAKVAGRMELFYHKNKDRIIFVDYAHNQLSFETLFQSIKQEYPDREISIVFGCPGKKALGRRKELGEIAGRNADKVYITEEDAGEEPLEDISKEIASYVAKEGTPHEMIPDREKAIRKAIQTASAHSVILITGKGRETRQKRGTEYIDTPSDVEIVERVVRDEK
jgi:UDP-N-acetylmuramoyl-L-alanyl-D-glutamate--2,6-diaminopimelate ligase